jgi:hypothetical protein
MSNLTLCPKSNKPRVGVFLFIAKNRNPSRFACFTSKLEIIPEFKGIKAIPQTHAQAWLEIQRIDQSLSSYAYDYFPRGRLEFFVPGRRWLLFLDPELNRGAFVAYLVVKWQLNSGHLTVKTDTAYASKACVGSP